MLRVAMLMQICRWHDAAAAAASGRPPWWLPVAPCCRVAPCAFLCGSGIALQRSGQPAPPDTCAPAPDLPRPPQGGWNLTQAIYDFAAKLPMANVLSWERPRLVRRSRCRPAELLLGSTGAVECI